MIGGPSLSVSYLGTFLVFVYVWLPFMILPMQASLERVPANLLEASADLGAGAGQTFRHVILPLAIPGIVAGSIFTFSLTLGDYIVPQIIGNSAALHRHGGLPAAGHGGEHPAGRRLRRGADRHHDAPTSGSPSGWGPSMRSEPGMTRRAPLGLTLAAAVGLLYLLLPLALIFLYAFTTDERSYTFPPPGLTTKWFAVAWGRGDVWEALGLSVRVAAIATARRPHPRHALRRGDGAGALLRPRGDLAPGRSCRSRCPASSPASRCARPSA